MENEPKPSNDLFFPASIPVNEAERIAALRALDILDSAEDDIYNSITKAAADICQTPMASLTFIDSERQWFKSRVGIAARETPRDISFCAHAINGSDLFLVQDTHQDERFRDNPLVTGSPNLRFYAGAPLLTESGLALGTLCVLDTRSRKLGKNQLSALSVLAGNVMRVLQLRRNVGVAVFAKAIDMASDGVTIADLSEGVMSIMYANESFLQLTGFAYVEAINQPPAFPMGPDCSSAMAALAEALSKREMTTIEARFERKDGELRWARVSFVPYVDEEHRLLYLVTVHRDITAMKEAEAQTQQLYAMRTTMATIAHVVKNFLNSAQLYSCQVNTRMAVDPALQRSFELALENTRSRLAAMEKMPAFKDRSTPFGFAMLDVEEKL